MNSNDFERIMNSNDLVRPWWLLPPGRVHPLWWTAIGVGLIWMNYFAGPDTQFPVIYVIPVSLAAWYSGRRPAVALAVILPLVHMALLVFVWSQGHLLTLIALTMFRGTAILVMALWFARLSEHERALYQHVQQLEGLLPICAFCKSIRNKAGDWEDIETYITKHSEAQFSHSFCPRCAKTHYPDFDYESASAN